MLINVLDKMTVKVNDDGSIVPIAWKGHFERMDIKFMNHKFSIVTNKIIFWADLKLDFCGG